MGHTVFTRGRGGPYAVAACLTAGLLLIAPRPAAAQIARGTYVGNGIAGRAIPGLGFRPDVVIVKVNYVDTVTPVNASAVLRTSTMVGDASKLLMNQVPLAANLIQSLDPNGFTVGNDLRVNDAATCAGPCTYYWVAFKADANLKVGTYTGNGLVAGDTQAIVGLGFSPEYVIVAPAANRRAQHRTSSQSFAPTSTQRFTPGGALLDVITSMDANGFTVMRSTSAFDDPNTSGQIYHYVAWNQVAGRVKVSEYTGNATDNRPINGVGFQPEYLIVNIYNDPTEDALQRSDLMVGDASLSFRGDLTTNRIQSLLPDGFEVGTYTGVNSGAGICPGPSDCHYFYVAFNAFGSCAPLTTTEGASSITVTAPDSCEMAFTTAAGGSMEQLYDLNEDPGKTVDLAGALASSNSPRGLHNFGMTVATVNYNTGVNDTGSRLHLLEATPTRVRLRQEAFYQNVAGGPVLTGVKGYGDYSITPPGKVALRWERRTTAPVTYQTEYKELMIHRTNLVAPLDTWATYDQSGAIPPNGPGDDDFLLAQIENGSVSPGAKTDVLDILHRDWTAGPFHAETANLTGATVNVAAQRVNLYWVESTGLALPAGASETWDSLTYIKPTIFTDRTDPAVTSRSADYRTPDSLAVLVGGPWLLASENTGGGDDFNEAEAAYALTLDPALGLTFRIDGSLATPRYHPFFKIRHWRSLAAPSTITLEGSTLTRDVDYRADVKPLSRAHFANTLSWHSTLEDANSLGVNLDVGSSGGQFGVTYAAGKYGNGVVVDNNADSVVAGSAASLDFDVGSGAVEFWYQPNYPNLDGLRHILWSTQGVGPDYFVLEKAAGTNDLVFTISNSGATTTQTVPSIGGNWAFHWLHIRTEWNSAAPVGSQLRILVNGSALPQVSGGVAYSAIGMNKGPIAFGTCGGGACPFGVDANANGIIDEAHIYIGAPSSPSLLAHGGLTANADEFLADPSLARNAALMNLRVDGSRRGQYVYFGADSQFRGLNVGLYSLGTGVGDNDLVWQYWNGTAWTSLESVGGFTDTTLSFKKTGNVYWQDPPAWAPYSVNGGPDLYYVRVYLDPLAPSDYGSAPVEGLIKTDILLLQYCGDITAAAQTFSIPAPVPTAVSLQSFSAAGRDSAVDLSWTTASELQNLGFHLYRSLSAAGPWTRITSSLLPGLGSSATGASYAWRDSGLANGTTYYYLLEDVETTGKTERHGPASATPQSGGSGGGSGAGGGDGSGGSGDSGRITWGDPSGASLRILERGPSHVVLELLTPGFTARTQSDGTLRVSIPGFEDAALPGALDVPVRHALVEALAGRRARLASVSPEDVVSFDSFRLAAAGTRDLVAREDGTLRTGTSPRRLLESNRRSGFTPRVWARLLGSLFQGETKKARLQLSPFRHDPVSGRTVLARRLTVRVEFSGTEAGERSLGGSRGRRPPTPSLRRSGVFAQLVARDPGLYRVRFEDVFAPGQRGLPARTLRLSRRGVPVPYHLEPERSLFGPGSSLFFVSDASEPDPRGESVFELSLGQTASLMETVSGSPSGPATTEHVHTLKLEQNKFYQSALLQAPDLWLWDLMVSPVTKSYAFAVEALSASSTSGHLKVVLQGASDFEELDHHLRLNVNGIPVAEATWDGMTEQVVEADLTAGVLSEGTNTLAIENVGDAGAAYSMVFLNRFDVSYPRLLVSATGKLEGRFDQSGRAEVSGLTGLAFVVDTTVSSSGPGPAGSVGAPLWLRGIESTPSGLAFRAETGRRYLAVAESALLVPEVRRTVATRLRSTSTRADWVLIAPREFLPAAQPLVELRRRQGLLPLAVALEDVFAEFGYGEARPTALRDFLAFAFHNWKTKPRYAVLLGDTTYDPKNYLGTGVKDRVPSPLLQTTYLWTVSDPSLAAVNGDDLLPDLAIGRLSAATLEEAQRLVRKLVTFEEAGRTFDGTAVLVADNADLAGSFEANQDEIAETVLQGRDVEKVYLRDLGASTRTTIRAAMDNGPGLLSYVGHGATAVWASENVWNNTDLATLGAQDQQPLLLTLNCLNGFFHFPPFDSLAEAFVKAEGKGAIAAFSPSGLSVNDAAHLYHKALLGEIASGAHTKLGDALLAAQKTYADQGAMPELLSIYHLFGDPGMRIR